jgi:hypothetical protein
MRVSEVPQVGAVENSTATIAGLKTTIESSQNVVVRNPPYPQLKQTTQCMTVNSIARIGTLLT